jgi:hypothetical protein
MEPVQWDFHGFQRALPARIVLRRDKVGDVGCIVDEETTWVGVREGWIVLQDFAARPWPRIAAIGTDGAGHPNYVGVEFVNCS